MRVKSASYVPLNLHRHACAVRVLIVLSADDISIITGFLLILTLTIIFAFPLSIFYILLDTSRNCCKFSGYLYVDLCSQNEQSFWYWSIKLGWQPSIHVRHVIIRCFMSMVFNNSHLFINWITITIVYTYNTTIAIANIQSIIFTE